MKRCTAEHFNFTRQQNSGAVGDFILPYSALYLRIQKWKTYWNRSTFAKVIVKIKVAPFLCPTVYMPGQYLDSVHPQYLFQMIWLVCG